MAVVAGPRITEASAFFMNELVKMEPGTESSGIYANKPGYHNSRAGNILLDKTDNSSIPDYSIRLPADLKGPSDKAAAYDWTHEKAHSGNYASMAKYGVRLLAAFNARDPRLFGWREALGQTDTDATPEGLDFVTWTKRTPDGTHSWHWHLSELRQFVESMVNKLCMLSVLRGQSLADYLAAGGKLLPGAPTPGEDDDMDAGQAAQLSALYYAVFFGGSSCGDAVDPANVVNKTDTRLQPQRNSIFSQLAELRADVDKLIARPVDVNEAELAAELADLINGGASAEDIATRVVAKFGAALSAPTV